MEKEILEEVLPFLRQGKDILVGPGDDCAVIELDSKKLFLISADQLVGGIHFDPAISSPAQIARKLIRRNISDIAAMGGLPSFAVMTICADTSSGCLGKAWFKAFFKAIAQEASKWKLSVAGGDLSGAKNGVLSFSMTICGYVEKDRYCLRKTAKDGDAIFVTGRFGNSYFSGHHFKFAPRLLEGRFLAGEYSRAMIDVSDGLLCDLSRMASASTLGASIVPDLIPLRKGAKIENAYSDGEDYELIFAVPESLVQKLLARWPFEKTLLTKIGHFSKKLESGRIVDGSGHDLLSLYRSGYEHFLPTARK